METFDRDVINVKIGDDHSFGCLTVALGRTGEHVITQLNITIPEKLKGYWAYLDFKKPSGAKVKTARLDAPECLIEYEIPQGLLDEDGNLETQLVLQNEDGEIWKSAIKKFVVLKSIDAEVEIPYKEDFITEAQKTLDTLEETAEDIKTNTEKALNDLEETAQRIEDEANAKIADLNIDTSNLSPAIPNARSGTSVALTDVSPFEHILKVSTDNVITCGKNHFDKDNADILHISFYGKGSKVYAQDNYTIYIPCFPNQVYTVSKQNGNFTFLRIGTTTEIPAVGVTVVDFKTGGEDLPSLNIVTTAEARYLVVNITNYNEVLSDEELSTLLGDIQIELGAVATEYEPYEVITPKVIKYGGNMLDIKGREVVNFGAIANTTQRVFTGNGIIVGLAFNNYYNPNQTNSFEKHTNGFNFSTANKSYGVGFDFKATPNTTYYIHCDNITNSVYLTEYDKDGNFLRYKSTPTTNNGAKVYTAGDNTAWVVINFQNAETNTIQEYNNISVGLSPFNGFEEYTEPTTHLINADGTVVGVTSLYPVTTLVCDTEGVVLDVGYNADTKKYIDNIKAELQALVLGV